MSYQKSEMQKKINAIEDEFLSKEETPENIQWFYDQMLEFINSEDFAEETLLNGTAFEALSTGTMEEYLEDYEHCDWEAHYFPANVDLEWGKLFTEEQVKTLEDTANERLDEFIDEYLEEHKNDRYEY